MRHKGMSGYGVERFASSILKWTEGEESSPRLMRDCLKQVNELLERKLSPIETVNVISFEGNRERFTFRMPYVDWHSVYSYPGDLDWIEEILRESFENRYNSVRSNFREVMSNAIDDLVLPPGFDGLKNELYVRLMSCPQVYPYGYAHGDLGFSNILVGDTKLFAIDFSDSPIYSPLQDIMMMGMSVASSQYAKDKHRILYKNLLKIFKGSEKQIDFLHRLKTSKFIMAADDLRRGDLVREICSK